MILLIIEVHARTYVQLNGCIFLLYADAIVQTDPQTVLLAVNGSGFVLYPEDIGTIDIVITLSGPRLGNTKVTLTLWSSSATGVLHNSHFGRSYMEGATISMSACMHMHS